MSSVALSYIFISLVSLSTFWVRYSEVSEASFARWLTLFLSDSIDLCISTESSPAFEREARPARFPWSSFKTSLPAS